MLASHLPSSRRRSMAQHGFFRRSAKRAVSRRLRIDALEPRTLLAGITADFDADGFADLAVGVPLEDIGSNVDAGAVTVIYGSANGLSTRNQFWHENSVGMPAAAGGARAGEQFGTAIAAGDFNGDGFADLAVGAPFEDIGAATDAGAVMVIYGSPTGLKAGAGAVHAIDYLIQGVAGGVAALNNLLDSSETNDRFGAALAAGNFNLDADGADDLAIGIPGEDSRAGAVEIVYGAATGTGLTVAGEQFFTQNTANVEGISSANDEFGYSLAIGFFNGDDNADLAIGVPGEAGVGAVNVIYSAGAAGLSPLASAAGVGRADQIWDQTPLLDNPESGDRFGQTLAAGDINGDGFTDLAVGVPLENVAFTDDGAVNVIFGRAGGLDTTGNQFLHQGNTSGVESNEAGDQFGAALATGDFDADGFTDLAIGIPFEDVGAAAIANAGAVIVLYTSTTTELWTQDSTAVLSTAQAGDEFGSALAAGDFNGDSAADLAIGVPGENVGAIDNAGAVAAIYGNPTTAGDGLNSVFVPNQLWNQKNLGQGLAEANDRFGGRLSSASAGAASRPATATAGTSSATASGGSTPAASPVVVTPPASQSFAPGLAAHTQLWARLLEETAAEFTRLTKRGRA